MEALAPAEACAVVLRYSWEGGEIDYELPLELMKTDGVDALWSCLLAVPKERAEVEFRLAVAVNGCEVLLDDHGNRYRAGFH